MSDEAVRQAKRDAQFVRNQRLAALSYVLDGFVLLLFWAAGTVGWEAGVAYTLAGLSNSTIAMVTIRNGWNRRLKHPNLVLYTAVVASLQHLTCMVLFPQVNFIFALVLFILYTVLTLHVAVRIAILVCIADSVAVVALLGLTGTPVRIPDTNLPEQLLSLAFFALTLLRCVWLGTHNSTMTALLKKRSGELADLTRQAEQLAHHDELTGLLNRRSLMRILSEERQRADRTGLPLCVGLLDIDRFKAINDTLGHAAGDRALELFADKAQQMVRQTDFIGRYGGEEFLIVMPGIPADAAVVPVDRFRKSLPRVDWRDAGTGLSITFSCGIAAYRPGESVEELLTRADDALYRAKNEGRDCTRVG